MLRRELLVLPARVNRRQLERRFPELLKQILAAAAARLHVAPADIIALEVEVVSRSNGRRVYGRVAVRAVVFEAGKAV